MIDLKGILINSNYKKESEELINIANLAYKHWETYWTGFYSTYAVSYTHLTLPTIALV